uniref:Predicted protein n=1 Tax=Physcomitrium patens TaxID=3218 RepID=A9U6I2_PHYPA
MNMEDLNEGIEIPQQEDESDLDNEVQILSGQVQSPRYSQPGHTEMLHSILITGVSRMRRTNSHDGFEEPIGSNFENPIRDSQWIQDRKYKGVLKINSLGCSGFFVTSRDLSAGAKTRLWQAVEEHPYRFTVHCCSRLYSSSQKLIDCLTIGESPYYLLQPDARRVLEQEST